jgi:hypothetical protein
MVHEKRSTEYDVRLIVEKVFAEYTSNHMSPKSIYSPISADELYTDMILECSKILNRMFFKKECSPSQYLEVCYMIGNMLRDVFQPQIMGME